MHVPDWFAQQLAAESDSRLRVRWSQRSHRFCVEVKAGRAIIPSRPISPDDDEAIRARDGFNLILEIAPGDRTECPGCARITRIPIRKVAEAKCEWCEKVFRACFFPLNEDLLLYLRYIDPDRGGVERVFRDMDAGQAQFEARRRRERHNRTEDLWKDHWNQVVGIPSVGYAGRGAALPAGR